MKQYDLVIYGERLQALQRLSRQLSWAKVR